MVNVGSCKFVTCKDDSSKGVCGLVKGATMGSRYVVCLRDFQER